MARQHPEVRSAIEQGQRTLEAFGTLHAVSPPDGLKDRILDELERQGLKKEESSSSGIPLSQAALFSRIRKWKRLAAAAIFVLIVSVSINVLYIKRYRQYRDRYLSLVESQQQLVAHNDAIETRLNQVEKDMHLLINPDVRPVLMTGVAGHSGMAAKMYWDSGTRQAFMATTNLPAPATDKDYQLWAIIDGKPVDMGLYRPARGRDLVPMKIAGLGKVQAFAITLEKKGGSPVPTLSQMYVMGSL